MKHSILYISITLAALFASGCTTTMTSMTDARAYEPGEVQASVSYQANVHTNVVGGVVSGVKSAAEEFSGQDNKEPISEESFRNWLDTALLVGLFRPSTSPEVIVRAGVTDQLAEGLDLGFRTNLSYFKGDAKLQLWESEDTEQAISLMAGYAYHRDWLNSFISYLSLTDFGRHDFDLQLLWGRNIRDILKVNVGPHVILSKVTASHKLSAEVLDRLPDSLKQFDPNQLFQDEWIGYYGANTNVMVGYKYAFIALDLGIFWMNFKPEVLGVERDYSSFAVSVAGGLSFHYQF